MNKLFALIAVLAATSVVSPAFADSDKHNVEADRAAIEKDDIALKKDQDTLARDRAEKEADKASGDSTKQAVDSTRIGAVETAIKEKQAEKDVDIKQLHHDQGELNQDK